MKKTGWSANQGAPLRSWLLPYPSLGIFLGNNRGLFS